MQSTAKYEVICIPPGLLGAMWPYVGSWLLKGQIEITPDMEAALKHLLGMVLRVHEDKAHVWAIFDHDEKKVVAALMTELIADKGRKVVWVSRMAGEHIMGWGKTLSAKMAEYASDEHAAAIKFNGRKALQKAYEGIEIVGEKAPGIFEYERIVS